MTRTSIQEYTEAVRWRYLRSPKTGKGKILDEFTKVTEYHRKAAIHLLHQVNKPRAHKKRGRPRQYSAVVVGGQVTGLYAVWNSEALANPDQSVLHLI